MGYIPNNDFKPRSFCRVGVRLGRMNKDIESRMAKKTSDLRRTSNDIIISSPITNES
jgi:hypothetical protein